MSEKTKNVVILDAEPVVGQNLTRFITHLFPEYAAHAFSTSEDLESALKPEDIGVAVLEIDSDGFDLLARLREGNDGIGAVMLSNYSSDGELMGSLEAGAEYTVKPMRLPDLKRTIERAPETRDRRELHDKIIHELNNLIMGPLGNVDLDYMPSKYEFVKAYDSFGQLREGINSISDLTKQWSLSAKDPTSALNDYALKFGSTDVDKTNQDAMGLMFVEKIREYISKALEGTSSLKEEAQGKDTDPQEYAKLEDYCEELSVSLGGILQYMEVADALYTQGHSAANEILTPILEKKERGENEYRKSLKPASETNEVYLVDDDPKQRKLVLDVLGDYSRHSYHSAKDLFAEFGQTEHIHLFMTDWDMGEGHMDGLEVLQRIRAPQPGDPSIDRVVVLSGGATQERVDQSLSLGASFIHKQGLDRGKLSGYINEILASPTPLEYNRPQQ